MVDAENCATRARGVVATGPLSRHRTHPVTLLLFPRRIHPTPFFSSPQRRPVWKKYRTRAKQTWKKMPKPMRAPRSRPT
eukprot:scaffold84674_cov61-Phaeocystis_antarctica.AAC.3